MGEDLQIPMILRAQISNVESGDDTYRDAKGHPRGACSPASILKSASSAASEPLGSRKHAWLDLPPRHAVSLGVAVGTPLCCHDVSRPQSLGCRAGGRAGPAGCSPGTETPLSTAPHSIPAL